MTRKLQIWGEIFVRFIESVRFMVCPSWRDSTVLLYLYYNFMFRWYWVQAWKWKGFLHRRIIRAWHDKDPQRQSSKFWWRLWITSHWTWLFESTRPLPWRIHGGVSDKRFDQLTFLKWYEILLLDIKFSEKRFSR